MSTDFANVHVLEHALGAVRLTTMRAAETETAEFRRALQDLSVLLFAEASRSWGTSATTIETPLKSCAGTALAQPIVLVPILRAGLGMLDGIARFVPEARVGHLGLYRDEKTLRPVTYFTSVPAGLAEAQVLVLDTMLATGFSACAAISFLKTQGARQIQFLCLVACPDGIRQLQGEHPEVPITTAAIDPVLNAVGYIVPGLGDAGDRYFGTT